MQHLDLDSKAISAFEDDVVDGVFKHLENLRDMGEGEKIKGQFQLYLNY